MAPPEIPAFSPLIRLIRGDAMESLHYGSIAVVDARGRLVDHTGDPEGTTFLRSCAKPLQVLPLLESGAAERFGFTPAELACMCGSLNGEDFQVQTVLRILQKIGRSEDDLQCGTHPPLHGPTAMRLAEEGKMPRPVHHNCAGKHAGMLALCVSHGWPIETYLRPDHPVQQLIIRQIARMTEVPLENIRSGTDGCGAPTFALPLRSLALAYAKMAKAGRMDGKRPDPSGKALESLMKALLRHPEMIGGEDRLCTAVMRAAPGRIFAKSGAEGTYALSLTERSLGIALKIADGNPRAIPPAVIEILRQGAVLDPQALSTLHSFGPRQDLRNTRKEVVGSIEPIFHLGRIQGVPNE